MSNEYGPGHVMPSIFHSPYNFGQVWSMGTSHMIKVTFPSMTSVVIIRITITSFSYSFPICYKHFYVFTCTYSVTLTYLHTYLLTYLLLQET